MYLPFQSRLKVENSLCFAPTRKASSASSSPSPKAEPFKHLLAKVGYERVQEIEDPELAAKRTRAIYKAKGYSEDWIEKRMRGIAIRDELTDEWKKRAVKQEQEYAILTAEIAKAAFGLTPQAWG